MSFDFFNWVGLTLVIHHGAACRWCQFQSHHLCKLPNDDHPIPSSLTIISSGFVCRLFNNKKTQEKNSIWNANKESHSQESTMSVTLNTSDLRLLLSRTPPNFHLYLLNDSYSAILGIHWLWILKNRKWAKTECVCIWHKINRQCCRRRCCCCCCCRTYRSTYIRVCMAWVRKRPNQLDFFTFQFFVWRKTLSFTNMKMEREQERGRERRVSTHELYRDKMFMNCRKSTLKAIKGDERSSWQIK